MPLDIISKLISHVEPEEMRRHLFYLARHPLPFRKLNYALPGHEKSTLEEADDYLQHQLEAWGYPVEREAVRVQAYRRDETKPIMHQYSAPAPDDPWYTAHNLYAKKAGARKPEEIILLVAHKDSQSWVDSPGANDNAVGTVGLLETARLLAGRRTDRSVWFLLCNEEHSPWTSITAAQNAQSRGDNIIAVLNTDGIGVRSPEDRAEERMTNVTVFTQAEGERLADLMAHVNEKYAIGLHQRKAQRSAPGDDDGSFVKAGFPAAVINIGSWPYADPNYHQPGDIPELVDVDNAVLAVKALVAAVLELDREPTA